MLPQTYVRSPRPVLPEATIISVITNVPKQQLTFALQGIRTTTALVRKRPLALPAERIVLPIKDVKWPRPMNAL